MTFHLVDDGTLDTVVECDGCGEQLRYTLEQLHGGYGYNWFVQWCLADAEEQHEECT